MKKKKSLVASLIAIVICFSMLLGTTYAWFTDSIVNTNNIIKSGNIDVELYHKSNSDTDYSEVDGTTKLFVNQNGGDILWEPGASATESFVIKNVGSLALKYKFKISALAKTLNVNEKTLLQVLTLTVNDNKVNFDEEITGELVAKQEVEYIAKIEWNSTNNDNEYNNLQILLGIELVATQVPSEYDGTGNEFDKDSQFPNLSTYVTIDNTSTQEVVLETKGENPVKATVPATIIDALPDTVTSISLAHTEPIEDKDNNTVCFEAIKLVDQDGNVIDLQKLGASEEITVTLPKQNVFGEGKKVDIYHDGKPIANQIVVGKDGVITYTTSHFSEVVVVPSWDGTVDTSWYNDTDTEFVLNKASQLAGLAELVDGGNTFEGKTIKLESNLNLSNVLFDPIGSYRKDTAFKGTFDGQGYTISNLSQNTWALDNGYYYSDLGMGLFGKVEDATVKNLKIDGASISGENGLCGVVAGAAYGDCTFDNITVSNTKCNDYQYYAGGVVGWASGEQTYSNITIDESTILGSQWGDFGNCTGGVIGGAGSSAKILIKDSTIACRIDAVNDIVSAYQWYCYRNCGMLIGQTVNDKTQGSRPAVAPQLTCENVTVIYGEWANYTYCEFAGTGYPYVRVQAGVSVDAYSNVRYGHPTDANGNTVVDDNHVHNESEDHHLLLVFDQLYGGSGNDRYCNYGVATHPGVTVIYNNK